MTLIIPNPDTPSESLDSMLERAIVIIKFNETMETSEWRIVLDALTSARNRLQRLECKHDSKVSAKNEVITQGWYCPDCRCLFSEDMRDKIEIEEEPHTDTKKISDEGLEKQYDEANKSITWYLSKRNDLYGMDLLSIRETLAALHSRLIEIQEEEG